jgi:pyrroloquinoline quinone biosynthesis protein B
VRAGNRRAEKVSSLGLVHSPSGKVFLFDATPDYPAQFHSMSGRKQPDGIFLTHAHIGHYTGLMYLGRETLGAKKVPVYATRKMGDFLRNNGPWDSLVKDDRIDLRMIVPNRAVDLGDGMTVVPIGVPHRDEYSDTVGYLIRGPRASALFIPDIDRWEKWNRDIRRMADSVDHLFLDGTFGSGDELPGRDLSKIPHPFMKDTRELLKGTRARLWFIHVNHSNPALGRDSDVVREGMRFDF